ncbi:hypothetical protein [Duncaniella freteri]|uniref:hypothetical protein n=1 Tax=Duncaniella freteri TaxID=2530391 RepID=UPI0025752BB9|nr:hypothetical protein [Duncaniella freteri]
MDIGLTAQSEPRKWYVLNYIPTSMVKSERSAVMTLQRFNNLVGTDLEIFAPKICSVVNAAGKNIKVERPLTYHYVFVKGESHLVKQLCGMTNGFSFVLNRGNTQRYAVVGDKQMSDFKRIADRYKNLLPFFSLEDIDLEDGDKVEVIEGDFPGLVGYYFPKNKSTSGNIVLKVTQNLGTIAYDIKAKYVKVLEFSKNSRRGYDQIDAFIPKLYSALRKYNSREKLTDAEISVLTIFSRRMEVVAFNNHKIEAKLSAILMVANRILGNYDAESCARERFEKRLNSITSVMTKAFVALITAVADNNVDVYREGRLMMSLSGDESSKAYMQLLGEYEFYARQFNI